MPFLWQLDFAPYWVTALALSVVALMVLSARPGSPTNRIFSLFLLLVAGNFLAILFAVATEAPLVSTSYYGALAFLFTIWDPAALLFFAGSYPHEARWLRRPLPLAAILGPPVVLTLALLVDQVTGRPSFGTSPAGAWQWVLEGYLVASYLFCLLRIADLAAGAQTPILRTQMALCLVAFGVAVLPRVALSPRYVGLVPAPKNAGDVAVPLLVLWALFAGLCLFLIRPRVGAQRRSLALAQAATASILVLVTAVWWLEPNTPLTQHWLFTLAIAGRWIVFAAIVGYALLRHQLLGYEPRRAHMAAAGAAFVTVVLLLFVVPGVSGADESAAGPRITWPQAAGVIAAAAGLSTAPFFLRGLRRSATGRDPAGLRDRRLQAYRAVLETLAAERRDDAEREELRVLRKSLGLSIHDHERLATLVRWQSSGPAPLDRYVVERPLGQGSWGQAYLARERDSGLPVVLKRLRGAAAADPEARDALLREATILRRIRHTHVVRLLDVVQEPEPVLVLEYVDGGSLQDLLPRAPMASADVKRIGQAILEGLAAVHEKGMVHRDVKPSNVLLSRDGKVKICDFGVAVATNPSATVRTGAQNGGPVGTLEYMAPEQAVDGGGDARSDLFAVGAILYRLWTGRPHISLDGLGEFRAREAIVRSGPPGLPGSHPVAVRRFFAGALAPRPAARFGSAREMAAALQALPEAAAGDRPRAATPRPAR